MHFVNQFLFSALRRKQKEDEEESETKKSKISYMNEDDDGKEHEHDVEKEKKKRERLVFLMSKNLFWFNDRFLLRIFAYKLMFKPVKTVHADHPIIFRK
jgi:hypothetical protein